MKNIDPEIMKHPANCQLLLHSNNIKKNSKSNISLNDLIEKIKHWDVSPLPDKQLKV